MKTERNAILRRPPQGEHPNLELKGIYKFMQDILSEIQKVHRAIEDLRQEMFEQGVFTNPENED